MSPWSHERPIRPPGTLSADIALHQTGIGQSRKYEFIVCQGEFGNIQLAPPISWDALLLIIAGINTPLFVKD